jgi:hypothetical protein
LRPPDGGHDARCSHRAQKQKRRLELPAFPHRPLPRLRAGCATKQRIVAQASGGIQPRPGDIVQALMCVAFREIGPPSMLKLSDAHRMLAQHRHVRNAPTMPQPRTGGDMKCSALLLAASMVLAWSSTVRAAGCQYDMQCKGDRICQQGQCTSPDADDQADSAAPKPAQSTTRTTAPATPAPIAAPAPPPAPAPAVRGCCTVAGKLRLAPASASDTTLVVGDACQGLTSSGKPVPGTLCN